ncbi:hypothetical protein AB0I00_41020 [Streptomyces sp. NPDC050803]|uniref:hypothetical protein n=1 Tax=unclassified Streptomyces TaxID=2593676 RepID=UPI003419BE65
MDWVVGTGVVLGLLALATGAATIRTGWLPPLARRRVFRPRPYGTGAILVGASCVTQGLFYFEVLPVPSWEVRFFSMNALMLSGLVLIGFGQLSPGRPPR